MNASVGNNLPFQRLVLAHALINLHKSLLESGRELSLRTMAGQHSRVVCDNAWLDALFLHARK